MKIAHLPRKCAILGAIILLQGAPRLNTWITRNCTLLKKIKLHTFLLTYKYLENGNCPFAGKVCNFGCNGFTTRGTKVEHMDHQELNTAQKIKLHTFLLTYKYLENENCTFAGKVCNFGCNNFTIRAKRLSTRFSMN